MPKRISRATLLKGMTGLAVAAVSGKLLLDGRVPSRKIPCRILGPSMARGHTIRDGKASKAKPQQPPTDITVTIIGGGIAGLSAAWWLKRSGFADFVLLEMERNVGGNSQSGKNEYSAYPWGAHYVPVANNESAYVRTLFEELGIIEGYDLRGRAIYNELYLCHEPQERLLKDGSFQEGLVPNRGLQPNDRRDIARFFDLVQHWRSKTGNDGRPAFAIPLDLSSQDDQLLALDRMSMAQWLQANDFRSKPLRWYVNYCCKDDYGSTIDDVSAWAGIHYFAGRRGLASNAELNSVVTWPEGNGFLVSKLKEQLKDHIVTGALVTDVAGESDRVLTTYMPAANGKCLAYRAHCVIFSAPRFLAGHIIRGYDASNFHELAYSPWMVSNITLKGVPGGKGAQVAWDNVNYASDSLGYVVATHQNITTGQGSTVITHYFPLAGKDPSAARHFLAQLSADDWSAIVVQDLEKMHPGIGAEIVSIDSWPWGHGMISPAVGFIWGDKRSQMRESHGNIFFAHSDMSGISNFEEAQYQGVEAAKRVLFRLGVS